MDGRCGHCGAPASPSGRPARCPACQLPASAAVPGAGPAGAAAWLPAAERAGAGGDLGAILRGYRRACALTQQQLADMLGYDRTYISMIESGRRHLTDRRTLARIARTLAIPPHVLGIADPDDVGFAVMLAFGTSVIRLARTARPAGRCRRKRIRAGKQLPAQQLQSRLPGQAGPGSARWKRSWNIFALGSFLGAGVHKKLPEAKILPVNPAGPGTAEPGAADGALAVKISRRPGRRLSGMTS
jgi:transcriptional regulator with XRE-family HTH domain